MTVLEMWKKLASKKMAWRLYDDIIKDNVFYTAGGIAYAMLFAIFPGMIFLLSLLPYLPIPDLHDTVMGFVYQGLPREAATEFETIISEVTSEKRGGLLSVGAVLTLWVASSGVYAIMQLLNGTYGVWESRSYLKARGLAVVLTLFFAVMVITALALIIFGGMLQTWMSEALGISDPLIWMFAIFRWFVILTLLLSGFALIYYYGPDVKQQFKFITPGSVIAVVVLVLASSGFRVYIENFGDYAATYGSLGAMMILMLWLYIFGFILLAGSEINALIEDTSPEGKNYGEKDKAETQPVGVQHS